VGLCACMARSLRRRSVRSSASSSCPGRSVNEGGTAVRAGTASVSRFSAVVRLRRRGLYRALVKVSNDGGHFSNYSEPILIR
jgi:hypothetical protein